MKPIVAVSGGFDPYHGSGHGAMIAEASNHGDVVVILNSDAWLKRKKGYVFMDFEERKKVMESIKGVIKVIAVDDSDNSVCKALLELKPDFFCNGGDRKFTNTPETNICEQLGIQMLWNVGGDKVQSSSDLVKALQEKIKTIKIQSQ